MRDLTLADLDEIERMIGKSALAPGPLTLAKLVALARRGLEPEKRDMTAPDRDPDWLLGLAQVRAQQILKLLDLYNEQEIGIESALWGIRQEAQAILDGNEPDAA